MLLVITDKFSQAKLNSFIFAPRAINMQCMSSRGSSRILQLGSVNLLISLGNNVQLSCNNQYV